MWTVHSDRLCTLEASLPIVVVQIALGHSFDKVNPADPFMAMIPPLGQYRNDYTLLFAESFSINSRDKRVVFKPYFSLSVLSECCDRGQIEFDNGKRLLITSVEMERFVLVGLSMKYLVLNLEEDTVYSTTSQNAQ